MRSKLIISPHWNLVSSPRVSICPSSPLPNLYLTVHPILQLFPDASVLFPQLASWNEYLRLLLVDSAHYRSWKWGVGKHTVFFSPPEMLEAVIALSDVMERPAALMGGRKPFFKWMISTCRHTPFLSTPCPLPHSHTACPDLLALFCILIPHCSLLILTNLALATINN